MAYTDVISIATAISAVVAGVAAIYAALYTRAAAEAARDSAKAAADQVELQRPRPIIIATFEHSFREGANCDRQSSFRLTNIGTSPAFDVVVSELRLPDESCRLNSEIVRYILPDQGTLCTHHLEPSSPMDRVVGHADRFANQCGQFFGGPHRLNPENLIKQHEILFSVAYRALDGRGSAQEYRFVVHFPSQRAWIEPLGSLLHTQGATDRTAD